MKITKQIIAYIFLTLIVLSNQQSRAQNVCAASLDKMNILYIGLDNPVTVAVSGVSADKISASIDNGKIEGRNGKYIVRVYQIGTATIELFSNNNNEEKTQIDKVNFRVKQVPNPVPAFMGKMGNALISIDELGKGQEIYIIMDNFDFDLSFPIVSFSTSVIHKRKETKEISSSNLLTENQKTLLHKAKVGDIIYIENVRVKKPSGQIVDIGDISLKVIQ